MRITVSRQTCQQLQKEIKVAEAKGQSLFVSRLKAILLVSWNLTIEQVAIMAQCSSSTIYQWIKLFLYKGIQGLKPKLRGGGIPRLNSFQKRRLKAMILDGSEKNGFSSGIWTSSMIQQMIEKHFGISYCVNYIPQFLRKMGMSYKKVDSVSHKADQTQQSEWEFKRLPDLMKQVIREGGRILFEDEVSFRIWSKMAHSWGEKGKKLEAPIHVGRGSQSIFGAIDLLNGQFIYSFVKKNNGDDFLRYLTYLVNRCKGTKVYLVIDNGPVHSGPQIRHYLDTHSSEIELVRLPSYSPKFNPIEKLWKKVKKKYFHTRYFANKKSLLKTLRNGLKDFQEHPEEVLSLMTKWRKLYHTLSYQLALELDTLQPIAS